MSGFEDGLLEVESPTPVEGLTEGTRVSILDQIKQDHADLKKQDTRMIPVVGYERTGLQAKYRKPETGRVLDDIARKVMREYKKPYDRNLYISIDTMINLCEGLYVQLPEMDEPVELDPLDTGNPVRFDETLAEAMEWQGVTRARQVVLKLFDDNDIAINAHAEHIFRWLRNTEGELEAELLESGEL